MQDNGADHGYHPFMSASAISEFVDQIIRGWRAYVLIAVLACVAALPGLGALPVLDRDEARFAQATRQMLETGDFVRIRLQEDARNKKPIGIHWLQASAVSATEVFTHKDNLIWAYRIPSLLGAILAAVSAFWAGRALIPRQAAFFGAALFASCLLISTEGMIAKTDAALAGFTTLAMAALAQLYAGAQRKKALALLFWAALGAGVLIKGPVTPLVAGVTLAALAFWEKRWDWMRPLAWWPGPLLAALIVLPWMIAIGVATDGAFFADAIGQDLAPKIGGGAEGHFAWPGYHLAFLSLLIFPATLALPAGARLLTRTLKASRAAPEPMRFLAAWAVPAFLVFELLPTKLAHYPLPTYPAIALLSAAGLFIAAAENQRFTRLAGVVLYVFAALGVIALIAWGAAFMPGDAEAAFRRAAQAALVGGVLLLGALAVMMFAPRPAIQASAAIALALCLTYTLRERILPEARAFHVSVETEAALSRARLLPNDQRALYVVGYGEISLVFLTRTDIHIEPPEQMAARVHVGDAVVIEGRELDAALLALAAHGLAFTSAGEPIRGHNYGNGDDVVMHYGQIEAPPPLAEETPVAPN